MNPLLQDVIGFLHDGRHFTAIRPEKTGAARRRVEFGFPDGATEMREYECDHATFMEWWKRTTSYVRSMAEAFREAEERL